MDILQGIANIMQKSMQAVKFLGISVSIVPHVTKFSKGYLDDNIKINRECVMMCGRADEEWMNEIKIEN